MGLLGAAWGLIGVILLLGFAIFRLGPIALDTFNYSLAWYHWLALLANIGFMIHAEGYRGFHQNFAPRVVARCRYLFYQPQPLLVIFAPAFAMCFFFTTSRQQRVSIGLTCAIICLVIIVSQISQPWRGIIDAGVVVGLLLGILSILYFCLRALTDPDFFFPAQLPESLKDADN